MELSHGYFFIELADIVNRDVVASIWNEVSNLSSLSRGAPRRARFSVVEVWACRVAFTGASHRDGADQTVSVECTLLIMLRTLACSLPSCGMQSVATLTHFSPRRRPGCVIYCLAIVTRRSSAGGAPRPLRRVGRVRAAAKAVYLTLVASGVAAPSQQPCFASHKCWVGSMS